MTAPDYAEVERARPAPRQWAVRQSSERTGGSHGRPTPTTTPIPPGLRLSHDLNDALTTWSSSQRTVIGLAADFADSGEWVATGAVSAAHWIAGVADIEVCTAREWIRVGRRLRCCR